MAYSVLSIEYFVRYIHNRPGSSLGPEDPTYTPRGQVTKKLKLMLFALLFNTLALFVRAVFRTIELSEGWNGRIIQTELYFGEYSLCSVFGRRDANAVIC